MFRILFFGTPCQLSIHKNTYELVNNTTFDRVSQQIFDRQKKFAWFDGKVYVPRKYHKAQLLNQKERLWLFMTVRVEIEKSKMISLKNVKHSSK